MSFLHGVEVIELDGGSRPIKGMSSSIIGLVGTATSGPLNQPILIAGSRKKALSLFGSSDGVSTIPDALDGIFDQTGAIVVVINVAAPSTYLSSVQGTPEVVKLVEGKGLIASLEAAKQANTACIPINLTVGLATYTKTTDYKFESSTKKISLVAAKNHPINVLVEILYIDTAEEPKAVTANFVNSELTLLDAKTITSVTPKLIEGEDYIYSTATQALTITQASLQAARVSKDAELKITYQLPQKKSHYSRAY